VAFGLAGVPLILAGVAFIKEPRRGEMDATAPTTVWSVGQTLRFIWNQKALLHVFAGAAIVTFWGWGLLWWAPAFYHRTFAMSVGDVGSMLGSIHLVAGTGAIIATVFVMKWMGSRDPRLQLAFLAVLVFASTIPSFLAFNSRLLNTSITMMWMFVPAVYMYFGPNFAMVNNLVPASMRGQAVAIYLLVTNFANLALAPQLVGWLSDLLASRGHDSAAGLRGAMLALSVTGFWGALHYIFAIRHLRRDLANAALLS
jgi:hypothetical protein